MHLELTDEEADLLRQILDITVKDLSPEIANTDNANYRRGLIDRREHVRAVLDRLGGPMRAAG
ncbi:MAG: hypothetical protein ACT452_13795 [Microthrixaceae bacterium]